jgi:hydroxymethylbilane synthase
MSKKYKIGTRGSLLAVTQCTLIKNEITKRTGCEFELELIKTQGDQQTDKALWQLEGKDFFTKELDAALLAKQVDLVVHSYKDLGSDRPEGIHLATITERFYAHDILLIKKTTIPQLANLEEIIIGTSSPRRIVNIESSLKDFLPSVKNEASLKCALLRGNVNTRIQKLKDDNYHAIVLALAGLERLANKEESKKELQELLSGLTFMILPQKVFPSSASQGALAIECHQESVTTELYHTLRSVHCEKTEQEVKRERKAFQSYGGGCHLAVGINVRLYKNFYIHRHKGMVDNQVIDYSLLEGADYSPLKNKTGIIILGGQDRLILKKPTPIKIKNQSHVFVTSKYCLHALQDRTAESVWSAGTMTSKQLAQKGVWVNGSADGLGHEEINRLASSQAVQLMLAKSNWQVLSHDKAESLVGDNLACYTHEVQDVKWDDNIAEVYFWSSFLQYEIYTQKYPNIKNKFHACGLGKTYDQFMAHNIHVFPFLDMESFRTIVNEVKL